jgi:hypothetical protein
MPNDMVNQQFYRRGAAVSGRDASRLNSPRCALAGLSLLDPLQDLGGAFQGRSDSFEKWDRDPANVALCGGAQIWLALEERFQFPVKSPAVSFAPAFFGPRAKLT